MNYGIRVFDVRATEGPRATKPLDFGKPFDGEGDPVIDRVLAAGEALVSESAYTGVPALHDDEWTPPEKPSKSDPQLYILSARRHGAGVLLTYKHGYYGEYEEARGPNGTIPLDDATPVRDYRAILFGPSVGHQGRLVVETIGRRCPVGPLVNWLGWQQRQFATATAANGTVAKPGRWIRIKAEHMADREHLKKMVAAADRIETELIEHRPGTPGSRKGVKSVLRTDATLKRASLVDTALAALDGADDEEFILKVAGDSGLDLDGLGTAGFTPDDAWIIVKDSAGNETKRINPAAAREKFTYPVSSTPIADDLWVSTVIDRLRGTLTEGTDINL